MGTTNIEYAINPDGSKGRNWNFYPGCNGTDGTPCPYCWAQRTLKRMKCPDCQTGKPHFHPERMREPLSVWKPTCWLVNFAGDWMGPWISTETIMIALEIMKACPRHKFLTLTKNPQRLKDFQFPDNCWVGVSATDWLTFLAATDYLKGVVAKYKWVSLEPLLKWSVGAPETLKGMMSGISWIVIGAQSSPTVLPKVEWVRELVEAADQAGVKVWLKNNLRSLLPLEQTFWKWICPDVNLPLGGWKLRQELPEVKS